MTNQTFAIRDFADSCGFCLRAAADAAFWIPGVRAVGIDRTVGTLTVPTPRRVAAAEFAAAIDEAGFDLAYAEPMQHEMAS